MKQVQGPKSLLGYSGCRNSRGDILLAGVRQLVRIVSRPDGGVVSNTMEKYLQRLIIHTWHTHTAL